MNRIKLKLQSSPEIRTDSVTEVLKLEEEYFCVEIRVTSVCISRVKQKEIENICFEQKQQNGN